MSLRPRDPQGRTGGRVLVVRRRPQARPGAIDLAHGAGVQFRQLHNARAALQRCRQPRRHWPGCRSISTVPGCGTPSSPPVRTPPRSCRPGQGPAARPGPRTARRNRAGRIPPRRAAAGPRRTSGSARDRRRTSGTRHRPGPELAQAFELPQAAIALLNEEHTALRVAAAVHERCPDARFAMVGDGPLRPEAEALARRLRLREGR